MKSKKSKLHNSMERIQKRLRGYRKSSGFEVKGVMRVNHFFVYDPVLPKIKQYLVKNHRWIIGLVVTVLLVPVGVLLEKQLTQDAVSQTLYFVPKQITQDATSLPVAMCWGSIPSSRYDAFRCASGNQLHDPCFTDGQYEYVSCPESPEGKQDLFKLTHRDEKREKPSTKAIPWYITLDSGISCRFVSGATRVVAEGRLDYLCTDRQSYLVLPIDEDGNKLTIKCFVPQRNRIEGCGIREAWF